MIPLEIDAVSFAHGSKRVLDRVSLAAEAGRVTILLGPNGAGKSTLFGLIARLYTTREGAIRILGRDLASAGPAALAPLGIVFQQPTLDLDLTVRQNLRYFAALRGLPRAEADRRIGAALTRLDMAERLDEPVRALNGGHRRRVEIARALLHGPRLLLLDEPTVGLDIPTRKALIRHVHDHARAEGVGVLWATHLIDEVEAEDDVVVLHRGRVVAAGGRDAVVAAAGAADLDGAFGRLTGAETSA